jgi:hypothetical protein
LQGVASGLRQQSQPRDSLKSRRVGSRLGTAQPNPQFPAGTRLMIRREEIYRAAVILLAALILSV